MRVEYGVVQARARQPSRGSGATGAHRQFSPSWPRRHGHPTFAQVQCEPGGDADALEESKWHTKKLNTAWGVKLVEVCSYIFDKVLGWPRDLAYKKAKQHQASKNYACIISWLQPGSLAVPSQVNYD